MRSKIRTAASRAPRVLWLVGIFVALLIQVSPAQAQVVWNPGDVFAAVGGGCYNVYTNAGVLKQTICDGLGGTFTTGCAFNPSLNKLYTTNFSQTKVVVYDNAPPHSRLAVIDTAAQGGFSSESIVFANNGEYYVGHADGNRNIQKYSSADAFVQKFPVGVGPRGSDWIELAADQRTIFYTSEGARILRFDASGAGAQLPDFSNIGGNSFALRLLPPGDGSGGLLVAHNSDIKRLNGSGAVVQTYGVGVDTIWFSLNLDPNGTSFWAGSLASNSFYRFNIATGARELGPINTGGPLGGLCIKGEPTASGEVVVRSNPISPDNPIVSFNFPTDTYTVALDQVLAPFNMTVTRRRRTSTAVMAELAANFPLGTDCIHNTADGSNSCAQYEVAITGTDAPPIPGTHFSGKVKLQIAFSTQDVVGNPGMAHAIFGSPQAPSFDEDILTDYINKPGPDPIGSGEADSFQRFLMVNKPLTQEGTFCGFQPPLPGGTFPSRRTLPVKFALTAGDCSSGNFITDAVVQLSVAKLTDTGAVLQEVMSAGGANVGNFFRYDFEENHYIFDLKLDGFSSGTYLATVHGDKLRPQSFQFAVSAP